MKSNVVAWIALALSVIALALVITQFTTSAGTAVIQSDTSGFGKSPFQVEPSGGGGGGSTSEAECTAQGGSWVCQIINGQQVCQCL